MDTDPHYHVIERLHIPLAEIPAPGWILDLGGGGEGVIGQLCGERVVSIDRLRSELEDAPGEALKIVMDAKDMQFLDSAFATAAAFFFFMFTLPQYRARIFAEIYRVLKPGGRLLLWEITIPPYPGGERDIFVLPLTVTLPSGQTIETGYGCPWSDHAQTVDDYLTLSTAAGFTLIRQEELGEAFYLEFEKPTAQRT